MGGARGGERKGIMRPRSRDKRGRQMAVIDGLKKRFGKFALVVAVATRAKELKEGFVASREVSGGTAIGWAITEIARGDVRIRGGKPGEEEDLA